MSPAASGASMSIRNAAIGLSRSSERPPPKIIAKRAIDAMKVMPIATAAATDEIRMSRCHTWDISWARTPWICDQSIEWSRPSVTHTAACEGLRPVANALG